MRLRTWTILLLCLLALPLWAQEKRVTIELKDAPIAEAFDQLFRAAGENFIVEPSVPTERRLTMRLVDIPFEKALNFLCDLAGLKWEKKDGVYVVSQKAPPHLALIPPAQVYGFGFGGPMPPEVPSVPGMPAMPPGVGGAVGGPMLRAMPGAPISMGAGVVILPHPSEQRCPKCGTVIRHDCPQCKRPMQSDWRFCPYDGRGLPPVPKKCPKCGATLVPLKPPALPPLPPTPPTPPMPPTPPAE